MYFDWFRPRKLARRFVAGGVSNREIAYLMLGNMLFGSVVFYGAFTWANPPWTLMNLLEFVAVVIITMTGFTKVYDAAGGDKNESFAVLFNCLSFGVWFWTTIIVWLVYWAVLWGLSYGAFTAYRFDNFALGRNLTNMVSSYEWFWTFLAAVLWQGVFYAWLARVIPTSK